MRNIIIISALFVGGCSYSYYPVVDLRASGEKAQLYDRDVMECKSLTLRANGWSSEPIFKGAYQRVLDECIKRRGHSVIKSTLWF